MHDTAYEIGRAFFDTYVGERDARVLEIGSLDVNGSLRDFARPHWRYVGADHVAGKGVDVVLTPDERLPFEDAAFDVVVATSVLEHDPFFWETFEELARVLAPEGLIYINSPSNGDVHRFPRDYWRFYPESGLSMAAWVRRKGTPLVLVESFVATRGAFSFNDYVAVFARSEAPQDLPAVPLHQQFVGLNALRHDSEEMISPSSATEDMVYLDQARRRAVEAEARVAELEDRLARASRALGAVQVAGRQVPTLLGHLDAVTELGAAGWAFSPSHPRPPVSIEVRVNGVLVRAQPADQHRRDLEAAGYGDGGCAFNINLSDLAIESRDEIVVTMARDICAIELGRRPAGIEAAVPPRPEPEAPSEVAAESVEEASTEG
jgi:SAM-dependent methyltransferase